MNLLKKLLLSGICAAAMSSALAEIIPAGDMVVPAGCTRKSTTEYVVRVPKRNNVSNTTAGITFSPDMKKIAGQSVKFSADLRASDIASDASGSHVGGKILISYKDGSGMRFYATPSLAGTTSKWQNFSRKIEIPADARDLTVTFGIQQGWGKLEVRNPEMTLVTSELPAGTSDIPPDMVIPDSNSKVDGTGYVVNVPKRNQISNTTSGVTFKPSMKQIAGKAVRFSAEMRGSDIASDASGSHVGGKILVSYKDAYGTARYFTTKSMTGTSGDWTKQAIKIEVPDDARDMRVIFGIQQGWGKLEVRNPRMEFVSFGLPADGARTLIPMDDIILGGNAKVNGDILTVNIPKRIPMPNQTLGGSVRLNLDNMREKVIRISCKCRYDVYSDTTGFHIGAKILSTSFDRNTGTRPSWHSSDPYTGKSDEWKELNLYLRVYDSTTAINLIFGIQQGWGKAEFRDLAVEVVSPIDGTPGYNVPAGFKCEYSPEVLAAAPRRGFMTPVPALIKDDDVREMGKWGANLIRYQMVVGIEHEPENVAEYMKWLNGCLDRLDALMPILKEYDIKVVIDMHQPVGGRFKMGKRAPQTPEAELACKITGKGDLHRIFAEADMRQAFIDSWKMIAARYKDNPMIFGYDLVNEPATVGQTPYHWADVQFDAAKAIREVDPETPIIVEGNRCASPIYFNMRPMPLKNIFYEIHMYFPGDYCFQGVYDKAYANEYPKRAVYYSSNREELRKAMAAVIEFQKKYGAKIFVGEFTAPRWVPDGGGKYLDDLISLYEDYKWDWTFHAFREWDGFSPEHYGAPKEPKIGDNERKATLQKYLKLNK